MKSLNRSIIHRVYNMLSINFLQFFKVIPPYCTFNRTIYQDGALQRCPTQLGLYISPYLKALYGLIAVVLLLNLLIAMYRWNIWYKIDNIGIGNTKENKIRQLYATHMFSSFIQIWKYYFYECLMKELKTNEH